MLALLLTMATGARATLKGSGTAESPYLISTSADWTEFCDNPSTYSSSYIKMTGFVTAAANKYFTGTFTGTFDGDGYTLTLNINGTGQKAPFMKIGAATIKNLRVAGNITATGNHSSGLVGQCTSGTTCYIQNCMVSATLTNTANLGGFIGHGSTATINMTDCVFNGTLNNSAADNTSTNDGSSAKKVGGFVSWEGDGTTYFNLSRCLFNGTINCTAGFTPFIYKYSGTNVTGSDNATCLYTVAQSDGFPSGRTALDGTSAVGQTASEIVTTMSNANWEVEDGRAWLSGMKTPYTISGIPDGWTVTADGNDVDVISGVATIAPGASVALTYTGSKYIGSITLIESESSVAYAATEATEGKQWTFTMPSYNLITTVNTLTLAEDVNNATWISDHAGKVYDITLTRTLQKGGWNTFSVPFSMAKPSGWTVKELTGASYDSGTKTLSLTFGDAASIEAGHAYLVKVDAAVVNPTFNDVTIVNSTTPTTISGVVEFVPAINPTALTLNDKSYLFVKGGNTLTWASSGSEMNGFRAYFHILDDDIALARAFSMSFGDDDVTGIIGVTADERITDGAVYTLDGRKLNGQPTQKGVYVVNGKKVIIK